MCMYKVYSRFGQHHRQGSLLDFGWSVETQAVHALKQLWFAAHRKK